MLRLVGEWRVTVRSHAEPGHVHGALLPDDEAPHAAELTFDGDGQVFGTGGVNRLRGTWAVDGDTLTFGPMVSTLMAGPPAAMRQESEILRLLGGPLLLRTADGRAESTPDPLTDAEADVPRPGVVDLVAEDGSSLRLERTHEELRRL